MGYKLLLYLFFLTILITSGGRASCQSYGLGFFGHEVVQDKRSGLDLSPGKNLCLKKNFEISFDLAFISGHSDYFGYIVRMIDEGNRNIDILYDRRSTDGMHFKVVIGETFSNIAFNIDQETLFNKWTRFRLIIYSERKQLDLYAGNKKYSASLKAVPGRCYKILFGANDFNDFKTTDVPAMKIRDVRIFDSGKLSYFWKLNEDKGNVVAESIKGADAAVINPLWIKRLHYSWQLSRSFNIGGVASAAFNPESEEVYIVGNDSLVSYSAESALRSFKYSSGTLNLVNGNQSLYSSATRRLYNICQDQALVSFFDFGTRAWSRQYVAPSIETVFGHMNKVFSVTDSAIYTIGGYGQFLYKNSLRRYKIATGHWDSITGGGSSFTPRYLAALGAAKGGFYILGGYGSSTGQQMLNPRNLYDLMFYDYKKQEFRKIYELKIKGEDFVFANSMIIDEGSRSFYALIFPKNKYNSNLRLIKGSLDKPEFKFLGNKIPYFFQDRYSFADLYFCRKSKKLVAVTLIRDESGQTKVNIFSLNSPPIEYQDETEIAESAFSKGYIAGMAVIAALLLVLLAFKKKKERKTAEADRAGTFANGARKRIPEGEEPEDSADAGEEPVVIKNSIFLFGDFQVFDAEGHDLTKHFTPLIKELFLILLLYTISKGRGISSEKLYELLWFDKSIESARNNRSVNITKLKSILDKMPVCRISRETGYWKIDIDYQHIFVDYKVYTDIVRDKNKLSKKRITDLAYITKRGGFLSDLDYSWLDEFKSEISNEVIDTYLHFADSVKISDDPEFLIQLANYIFYFDPVNEEAMTIKCKSLAFLGKHSLAKTTFETFVKEYRQIYDEDFESDFNKILNK